jgi:hypothetical protein
MAASASQAAFAANDPEGICARAESDPKIQSGTGRGGTRRSGAEPGWGEAAL